MDDIDLFFIDIGRSVAIITIAWALLAIAITLHVLKSNRSKIGPIQMLNPFNELRDIFLSSIGVGLTGFFLCIAMYLCEYMASRIVVGVIYIIFLIFFFKKEFTR